VVVAARNLPAGTAIQAADVKISEVGIDHPDVAFENGGLTNDRTRVIGHTTKVDISEGYSISINDIEP
jgi:flagella basal body P-ring formation protein FlgA